MYIGGMSNNYSIPVSSAGRVTPINTDNNVDSSSKVQGAGECKTCQNRRYVDGSDENNVSYKTPGNIKPEESFAKVKGHELEHVSNAVAEGSKKGAALLSATVSLKMGTCPECGKTYVAGGLTKTQIKYTEANPYDKGRKLIEGSFMKGANVDQSI